jgi:hypothetical protein
MPARSSNQPNREVGRNKRSALRRHARFAVNRRNTADAYCALLPIVRPVVAAHIGRWESTFVRQCFSQPHITSQR